MKVWDRFYEDHGKKLEWDNKSASRSPLLNNISKKILRKLEKENWKNLSVLELGGGIGLITIMYAQKGANVTLLDNAEGADELAKQFWGGLKHEYAKEDLFKYSPKKEFDVVTSFGLCEHFIKGKRREILERHIKFLKKDGVVFLSTPYKYGVFYRAAKFLMEITGRWKYGLEVPFSKSEYIKFAKEEKLDYEIIMGGFYASAYDLLIKKPLKMFGINVPRKFENTKSLLDRIMGNTIIVLYKRKQRYARIF